MADERVEDDELCGLTKAEVAARKRRRKRKKKLKTRR